MGKQEQFTSGVGNCFYRRAVIWIFISLQGQEQGPTIIKNASLCINFSSFEIAGFMALQKKKEKENRLNMYQI